MNLSHHSTQTMIEIESNCEKPKENNSSGSLNPEACVIVQYIDTQTPVKTLRDVIGKRLRKSDLSKHDIYLQQFLLDPEKSLFDQGIKVDGTVELSIQVQTNDSNPKLLIVEIAKLDQDQNNETPSLMKTSRKAKKLNENQVVSKKGNEREEFHGIPANPSLWTEAQVYCWVIWIANEFGFDVSAVEDHHLNGQMLASLSRQDFIEKFPHGDLLWSHLELLKKLADSSHAITLTSSAVSTTEAPISVSSTVQASIPEALATLNELKAVSSPKKMFPLYDRSTPGNRSGNNGQIQLWQFLLEMLTDADCRDYIRWVGDDGEFKLLDPQVVAQKWGERKNKPAMNYEKLSRALRYYYDSEILCKVAGKRFVYKFICNLKELVGFDAAQLDKLVNDCAERRRKTTVDKYLHTPNAQDIAQLLGNLG